MKSDVYFIEVREKGLQQRKEALEELLRKADPFKYYKKDEIIPVKLTIGDSACVYHMGPELVKAVVFKIKDKKAKPFLFDTSVIYKGSRQNAIDHLTLAQMKGFSHTKVGAPFIIADGPLGQDGNTFDIKSDIIKKIKVPSLVGMFESLVVLSHVTGHVVAGYAGALKNVAMGMSSRATKQIQHSSLKPSVVESKCTSCGSCLAICPVDAISFKNDKAFIDKDRCVGCAECICACKFDAILVNWDEDPYVFGRRMAEVAKFIIPHFKNRFFINFAFDITYECDCISTKNEKMAGEDTGIIASQDMVSADKATLDLVNKKGDVFTRKSLGDVHHRVLEYAAEKGLGNLEYNLIRL